MQLGLNLGGAGSCTDKWKCVQNSAALLPVFSCTAFAKGTSCLTELKPFCCYLFLRHKELRKNFPSRLPWFGTATLKTRELTRTTAPIKTPLSWYRDGDPEAWPLTFGAGPLGYTLQYAPPGVSITLESSSFSHLSLTFSAGFQIRCVNASLKVIHLSQLHFLSSRPFQKN